MEKVFRGGPQKFPALEPGDILFGFQSTREKYRVPPGRKRSHQQHCSEANSSSVLRSCVWLRQRGCSRMGWVPILAVSVTVLANVICWAGNHHSLLHRWSRLPCLFYVSNRCADSAAGIFPSWIPFGPDEFASADLNGGQLSTGRLISLIRSTS